VQPLFDEKLALREKIYASGLDYLLISCGIFTDFLFGRVFGVVDLSGEKVVVRAPGSFDISITCTSLVDIAALTARLMVSGMHRQEVKISGSTLTYQEIANIVEEALEEPVQRELLSLSGLQARVAADPNDIDARYHLVIAAQKGMFWPDSSSWNVQHQIPTESARDWAMKHLREQRTRSCN